MTWHISPTSHLHSHWIFAFYGYGQQAKVFEKLEALCAPRYGLIIIDLPYEPLEIIPQKKDFAQQIKSIIESNNIQAITGISFSIGSRYNLLLAELLPSFVRKVILIAPDGIYINFWNRLATSTFMGQAIFKFLMLHPDLYQKILQLLYRIRLLPSNLFAFIKWHVRNKHNSIKVYNTWLNMKNMIPDLNIIDQNQRQFEITFIAIFGKYDFVIKEKTMLKLKKVIPATEIIVVEKDHNLLDDSLFHDIASYL